ncbi:hypothetical protein AVEN_104389-1 [Araneus ventricosus]|uniref:Reverse transcriptase/retrotransposon-derived protein RNase H-like domain-containing protein n=1 Tax=Araneus ventricosus TaxID=182803 RepID=A0A4Y2MAW3_ARAVE|nr:hypothetical protein AVEN_104389-1 [Araneus ventricosus]
MAVLPPLEKRILQSRESDADAEMSSSSASEGDALEYNMSEALEDSPAVISPPPPSKPEKANKYKNSFLKDEATIAEPLHRLLEKNAEWKWTSAHEKAFAVVKELLSSDSVLVLFNEKLPLILTFDASPYGVGYVFLCKMKLTPDIRVLSPRMLRWSRMLNAYDFTVIHRPGKKIQNANSPSRLPLETPETDIPSPPKVLFPEELHNPPVKAD